jgi:lipopolysaccharide export system permease protein
MVKPMLNYNAGTENNMTIKKFFNILNPWRNSRLETYLFTSCLKSIGGALLVVISIISLLDYMEVSKNLSGADNVSGLTIIGLVLQKSPSIILILMPFAFLFGSQFAFITLNRRSELIAMRAAGVSAWRFIWPATLASFFIGILTIGIFNPLASLGKQNFDQMMLSLENRLPVQTDQALYLRQGDGKRQVVIRSEGHNPSTANLQKASFWVYDIDDKGIPSFIERLDAQSATLRKGVWDLKNVYKSSPGEGRFYFDKLSLSSNLEPEKAFVQYKSTQSVPFWKLNELISQAENSGFSSNDYKMKWHELLSTPLMFAAMTALGAAFSLRLMRLGNISQLVVSGLGLGFVIFFVNQIFTSMGKAEVIPTALAGWSPAILAALSACLLIILTEDG